MEDLQGGKASQAPLQGQGEGLWNEEIVAAVEGLPVVLQSLPTDIDCPRRDRLSWETGCPNRQSFLIQVCCNLTGIEFLQPRYSITPGTELASPVPTPAVLQEVSLTDRCTGQGHGLRVN